MGLSTVVLYRMPKRILWLLPLVAFSPLLALPAEDDLSAARKMLEAGSMDGPAIAAAIKDTFMSKRDWEKEVTQFWSRFKDWESDTGGNVGRYLNDRMILVGLGASGGKPEKLKKAFIWLAMYKEFDEEQPSYVTRFLREHRESLTALLTDFNWEKAAEYVKNRQWRKDADERKKLASAAKS